MIIGIFGTVLMIDSMALNSSNGTQNKNIQGIKSTLKEPVTTGNVINSVQIINQTKVDQKIKQEKIQNVMKNTNSLITKDISLPDIFSVTVTSDNILFGNTPIDVGQTRSYTAFPNGGKVPYRYSWGNFPTGCSGILSQTITCTPSEPFSGTLTVVVEDNGGGFGIGTINFVVNALPSISSLSAVPASADIGQTMIFSANESGGTGPLTYSWHNLPGCTGPSSASSFSCTVTSVGIFDVSVKVTDSALPPYSGYSATSPTVTVHTYEDPIVSIITSSKASGKVEVGQNVVFNGTVSGGSGNYSYSWSGLPTGCSSTYTNTTSCIPTADGTFNIKLTVNDSNGYSATSQILTFVVLSALNVNTLAGSVSSLDVGQNITFSTMVSGGSLSYNYVWNGLPTGCSTSNTSIINCYPTATGTFMVNVTVTDSNGFSIHSSSINFTVFPSFSVATPIASPSSIDLGQSVTFTSAQPQGGLGPYTYSWNILPSGCIDSESSIVSCTPNGTGSYTASVTVTDSNGNQYTSPILTFSVNDDPIISQFSASPQSLDVGQNTTFTIIVQGGSGSYNYVYNGLPAGCNTSNTATLSCSPTTTGNFTINATVTDSNNFQITSSNIIITVNSTPSVNRCKNTSEDTDRDQHYCYCNRFKHWNNDKYDHWHNKKDMFNRCHDINNKLNHWYHNYNKFNHWYNNNIFNHQQKINNKLNGCHNNNDNMRWETIFWFYLSW